MAQNIEFQGKHARRFNQRPSFWRSKSITDSSRLQLKSGERLLDVGCGTGTDLDKLFKRYGDDVELYGVDTSEDMLKQAPQQLGESSDVHLSQASALKLPSTNNFFDYLTCSLVLHHLSSIDQQKALKEMYRVLKPRGTLLIKEWGKPTSIFGRFISWLWRNHAYVSNNTSNDLRELLKQAGFKKITIISVERGIMYQLEAIK